MTTKQTRQPRLTASVIRQLGGREYLRDIANHGADGGFPGFTYYADTVAFAKRNKSEILERLAEDAVDLGESGIISCMTHWRCLKGLSQEEIADGLYNPKSENKTQVFNALAWYAAEEVAREFHT